MKKLLVGITGGMGAGKSLLATYYRDAGFPVFSADEIAREIVTPGSPAYAEIAKLFGPEAIRAEGTLDRSFLRAQITTDPALRAKLEAITHPRIQNRMQELAEGAFTNGASIVFYEAPLLFEARNGNILNKIHSGRKIDKVICVHAPDELRIERVMKRDGTDRLQTGKLLASQMAQDEKMRRSDYLVENTGGSEELKESAEKVLGELRNL